MGDGCESRRIGRIVVDRRGWVQGRGGVGGVDGRLLGSESWRRDAGNRFRTTAATWLFGGGVGVGDSAWLDGVGRVLSRRRGLRQVGASGGDEGWLGGDWRSRSAGARLDAGSVRAVGGRAGAVRIRRSGEGVGNAEGSPGLVGPRNGARRASCVVGEAAVHIYKCGGIGGVCEVGAYAFVTRYNGEGGEAVEGARGGAGGPVFGGVDWRVSVPVAGAGVGPGGGEVQLSAAAIYVENGIGVRDKGVAGRCGVVCPAQRERECRRGGSQGASAAARWRTGRRE